MTAEIQRAQAETNEWATLYATSLLLSNQATRITSPHTHTHVTINQFTNSRFLCVSHSLGYQYYYYCCCCCLFIVIIMSLVHRFPSCLGFKWLSPHLNWATKLWDAFFISTIVISHWNTRSLIYVFEIFIVTMSGSRKSWKYLWVSPKYNIPKKRQQPRRRRRKLEIYTKLQQSLALDSMQETIMSCTCMVACCWREKRQYAHFYSTPV